MMKPVRQGPILERDFTTVSLAEAPATRVKLLALRVISSATVPHWCETSAICVFITAILITARVLSPLTNLILLLNAHSLCLRGTIVHNNRITRAVSCAASSAKSWFVLQFIKSHSVPHRSLHRPAAICVLPLRPC